ncbi:MAG: PPC domain-containing protein [Verrucomicrobiae bacterium]|nr:PPC domain-containing protein [Verrucomicrobiae bacterium]MCP5541075.1 PPC domain-containing protein [Akkermansiaceae bacterium]
MRCILYTQSAVARQLQRGMLAAVGLTAFFVSGQMLRAASPDLQNTLPRGGQRGTEVKITLTGDRLDDAQEMLFHYPGITCKELKVVDAKKVEVTLVIAPDARLGEHHLRLRCASGITYARNFWVSQFPNVDEVEPNDDFSAPQAIAMNVTVEGEAKPEETDYYKVTAKKGERITVEMEALRINNLRQSVAVDPYVAILDKNKFELDASDDSALLKQDSVASIIAPEDGEYVIEIRDSAYQGRGRYRAHIGTFPRPMAVYPAGGKAGSEVEFTLLGDKSGVFKQKVKLPASGESRFDVFGQQGNLISPSGNAVRVVSYDNVLETEPNNTVQEATPGAALPLAFNGVLEKEGDTDYFKFSAKKGERFRFRSYANKIGSPVDTVLYIYDAAGKAIANSDDADGSSDSRIDFTAPADGEFVVRMRDMLDRGGEDFVYRIESEPFDPAILVTMPEMIRRDSQYHKQFNVPKGGYYAMNVNVSRQNFGGELQFELPKLPAGVTWEAGNIPKNISQFPILFKAAPDAPVAGGMYTLNVKNIEKDGPAVTGAFEQELDFVRGEPNGTLYYATNVPQIPIAVTEAVPFSVAIDAPKVPIVRDGTMKLKVRATRKDGYDKKIIVRMLWNPPGISSPATMTFNEKDTELEYELNANANAELGKWKIVMMAESDSDKGKIVTASPFAEISVEEPFVSMKMSMGNVTQGQKGAIAATIEQIRPFDGQADLNIFGLPAKSTSETQKITKELAEIQIPVVAAEDTPVGQHKNLFCTLVVMQNGQPITHRVGMGGVLRVDPKPKEPAKPAAAPDPKKAAVAKTEQPAKPLSRLEQLRLDAQKQAEGQKK